MKVVCQRGHWDCIRGWCIRKCVTESVSEIVPEGGVSESVSEGVTESVSEIVSESGVSESVSEGVTDSLLDGVSEFLL